MSQTFVPDPTLAKENPSAVLAEFFSGVRFDDLPAAVVARAEEAFVDWFGCALAGKGARQIQVLEKFATEMGPSGGRSEILTTRKRSSSFFAALVNGAASHIVEQDDVHNGGMFHPGATVFPAILAVAQEQSISGKEFIVSSVVGYEAAIRTAEFLGPEHYKVFHTTGTAGMMGAAAGVARLLHLDAKKTLDALGTAGTQATALWEFLKDGADSKILHTGRAAASGLMSAYLARDGFTGATHILEGKQGLAVAMSRGAATDTAKLTGDLGIRWAILECTYKPYSSCRHTHPSADALMKLMRENNLEPDDITHVAAHVHQGALDVLGSVIIPETVYEAKFSMGFVLALAAIRKRIGIDDFSEESLSDPKLSAFRERVEMVLNPDVPRNARVQPGWVEVETRDGRRLETRVPDAKGDPQNTLTRGELVSKAQQLAMYAGAATAEEVARIIAGAWKLHDAPNINELFLGEV